MKYIIPIVGVISFFCMFIFGILSIWFNNSILIKICLTSVLIFLICVYFKDYADLED